MEKIFTIKIGDSERKVKVVKPSGKIEAESNIYSSKIFSQLIKQRDEDGYPAFLVRSKLDSYLRDIGLFTEQDIKDIGEFGDKIGELENKLKAGGKKKEGREIAVQLRNARYHLLLLLSRRAEYDRHTVEAYSENAKSDYLLVKCLQFEDGEPIFSSIEDYKGSDDLVEALNEPVAEFRKMTSLYDPDFNDKLMENKFLKQYGFCDDQYNLVDNSGRRVDDTGALVNKEGYLVDEEGHLIDEEGVIINKELGEFLDDDEEVIVKKKPRSVKQKKV